MPAGRHHARRRGVAEDSDTDSEDGYLANPAHNTDASEAQREETLRQIAMADLGSGVRDFITSVDYRDRDNRRPNKRLILAGRDCNNEGTEASERVQRNRPATNQWNNFGNTDDAKKGVVEQLEDICGGQTHRLKVKDQLLAEAAVLGRELSIEDTYDDRRRRHGIFPSRVSRGGAQATANDRGHFGGGRGGGNAGRGPGRVVPPAASSSSRPLDPAVDPDRVYGYKDKTPRSRTNKKSTATMNNNNVRVVPAAPTKPKAMKENKSAGNLIPSAPKAMSNVASISPKSNATGSSSGAKPLRNYLPGPGLADSSAFMAAVRGLFALSKPQPSQSTASASTSAGPTDTNKGLLASKYATPVAPTAPKEMPIHRLAREEFRDPDLSPAELTDALPSTGQLSMTSPSIGSDDVTGDPSGGVGLGISFPSNADSNPPTKDTSNEDSSRKLPDIMDIVIPEVKKEALVASPTSKSPTKEMVAIPKAEMDEWNAIKALMKSGDTAGLMKHMGVPLPTQLTEAAAPKASVAEAPKPAASISPPVPPSKPASPTDSVQVSSGYAVDTAKIDSIIGNDKNLPKGRATQTTPSLAASKWASGPRVLKPAPQKSTTQELASVATRGRGHRASSPITISSTSSSSYSSAVEYVATRPATQQPLGFVHSTSASNAITQPETTANPFVPRESISSDDNVILDYGEPAKVKSVTNGTFETNKTASTSTARGLGPNHAQILAAADEKLREIKQRGLARSSEKEKTSKQPATTSGRTPNAGAPAPIDPGLEAERERMKADMKAILGVTHHINEQEEVRAEARGKAKAQQQPSKPMVVMRDVVPQATTTKPTAKPSAISSTTSFRTSAARPGLAVSKWATAAPTPPVKAVSTLKERSPNKSPQVEQELGVSTAHCTKNMVHHRREVQNESDAPIFGDARNVRRGPPSPSSTSILATRRFAPMRKPTAIKRIEPGAGYEQLLRDLKNVNLGSASKSAEVKSAQTTTPLGQARGLAQQVDADDGDSTESEL